MIDKRRKILLTTRGKFTIIIQVKHSKRSLNGYVTYHMTRAKYAYKAEKGILLSNNH